MVCQASFNTQPPEGGCFYVNEECYLMLVSTHSRPKAAGFFYISINLLTGFNTQPPEGGCFFSGGSFDGFGVSTHSRPKAAGHRRDSARMRDRFNTQPPEGGWLMKAKENLHRMFQHTAARRRLLIINQNTSQLVVSTHSRPKAAGIK